MTQRDSRVAGPGPTFSIVMSAYRTGPFIERAIASVIEQTRHDWELVVVDDGSPDDVAERIRRHDDGRIRLIRQPNRGCATAMNVAAEAARGRLLVRLDSDDWLLPGYLERAAQVFAERPGLAAVAFDALVYDDLHQRFWKATWLDGHPHRHYRRQVEGLLRENFVPTAATIARSAWQRLGGFDPEPMVVEDWDFWLRMALARLPLLVLEDPAWVYRLRPDSDSHDAEGADRLGPRVERTLEKHILGGALSSRGKRIARSRCRAAKGNHLLVESRRALFGGRWHEAREHARQALLASPRPRAVVIVVALHLSPRLLRAMHRARDHLRRSVRLRGRLPNTIPQGPSSAGR